MAKGTMIIDGLRVPFDGEKNVLSVIRKAGIDMPTFCYYSELSVYGACRMCIVEDVKTGKIDASCSMEPRDGLEIRTNTSRLLQHRRLILELLLASHDCSCTTCGKSGNCRLQELAQRFGVRHIRFPDTRPRFATDNTSHAIFRDPNKCILCGDCVRVCEELQGQGILNFACRGSDLQVMPAFDQKLAETNCVGCGPCAPPPAPPAPSPSTGPDRRRRGRALHDREYSASYVQIAPAVRVAVGEDFGLDPPGRTLLEQARRRAQADGRRRGLRHQLRRGPDGPSAKSAEFLEPAEKRRPLPHVHQLLSLPGSSTSKRNNPPLPQERLLLQESPMEMLAAVMPRSAIAEEGRRADGRTNLPDRHHALHRQEDGGRAR